MANPTGKGGFQKGSPGVGRPELTGVWAVAKRPRRAEDVFRPPPEDSGPARGLVEILELLPAIREAARQAGLVAYLVNDLAPWYARFGRPADLDWLAEYDAERGRVTVRRGNWRPCKTWQEAVARAVARKTKVEAGSII
jgi:hypothetical protein